MASGETGTSAETGSPLDTAARHTGSPPVDPGPADAPLTPLTVSTRSLLPPDPTDHEVDPVLGKAVFTDTITSGASEGTWVWVATLGGDGDWVSLVPELLSRTGDAVPLTGEGPAGTTFPNTAEWSRARAGASRVYWSAQRAGGPARIQFNEDDPVHGFASDPTPVVFAGDRGDARYLVNASYSDGELDDRFLVYLRTSPGGATLAWCLHRDGVLTRDEPLPEPYLPPTGISFTVRPIPDAYAVVMARPSPGRSGGVDLLWNDLVADGPASEPVVLHTWREGAGVSLVGVGAIRAPLHDTPDLRAYAVYALVHDRSTDPPTSWYDTFLVRYRAPSWRPLGAIDAPGRVYADRWTVTVAWGRRMVPDRTSMGPYTQLFDDEGYLGVDRQPYLAVVMSPDLRVGTDTRLWRFEALGDDPGTPYELDRPPPVQTPSVQDRLTGGDPGQLLDPEPVPLLDTSVDPPVWRDRVLYRRSVEVSPGVVGHDFWRATPGREPDP
ncbi:MAG: hypothetical protein H6735_33195 [Alphaproteobacteria bacterium]|nr:hypothetical protein [Alphaproteobacteria bacterium]